MTQDQLNQLGKTLWGIADQLRGAMNADDFRDYMLSFLFLRYLSDNYATAAAKELGSDYPKLADGDKRTPLAVWYAANTADVGAFEAQMRRKTHYVIRPEHLWSSIAEMARTHHFEARGPTRRNPPGDRRGDVCNHKINRSGAERWYTEIVGQTAIQGFDSRTAPQQYRRLRNRHDHPRRTMAGRKTA